MKATPRARTVLYTSLLLSSAYMAVSVPSLFGGSYNCCGDQNCGTLYSTEACPSGSSQCEVLKKCCENRCNQP